MEYTRRIPAPSDHLTRHELDKAIILIIRSTQLYYFSSILHDLRSSSTKISPRSFAQLSPFIDGHGIIRVGGRLRCSSLSTNNQHPILLSKVSVLTTLVIHHFHIKHLHAGAQFIASILFLQFWVMSNRLAIRRVIYESVIFVCAKHRAVASQPIMRDLPFYITPVSRSFLNVGIDFQDRYS